MTGKLIYRLNLCAIFGLSFRALGIDVDCSHFLFSRCSCDLANEEDGLKWPNMEKRNKREWSSFESV